MGLFANAFKIGAGIMTAQILFLAIGMFFLIIGLNMISKFHQTFHATPPMH